MCYYFVMFRLFLFGLMVLPLIFSSTVVNNVDIEEKETSSSAATYRGGADMAVSFIPDSTATWYVQYLKKELTYEDITPEKSTIVYVVDAQIDKSPTVLDRLNIEASYDFTGEGFIDKCGNNHGLIVSSIIGNYSFGIAKGVRIVGLKVFPCDSEEKPIANIIEALQWVAENANLSHYNIVNLSLSSTASPENEELNHVLNDLVSKNISIVSAAGNIPVDACERAVGANINNVTVVGGLIIDRDNNTVEVNPEYSYGECIDMWAPSDGIYGYKYKEDYTGLEFVRLSGTSLAAALYSGVLATKDNSWREIKPGDYKF